MGGDPEEDYVLKRLIVRAKVDTDNSRSFYLVAFVEVEVVSIEDGQDEGFIDQPVEVYRTPFLWDVRSRKSLLREMILHPKFSHA